MFGIKGLILVAACAAAVATAAPVRAQSQASEIPLEAFLKRDVFEDIKLSPTGEYYAATLPVEDSTVLVMLRRDTLERTGYLNFGRNFHVVDFWWANDQRVVAAVGESSGSLEQPERTGELVAIDVDGSRQNNIFGYRSGDGGSSASRLRSQNDYASAFVIDTLDGSPDEVLIAVWPWQDRMARSDPYTQVDRINVNSGRRRTVARAPVRSAYFVADRKGEVRFAIGSDADNNTRTYYRVGSGASWELLNDEALSGVVMVPLAFDGDERHAYLRVGQATGPDAIERFDVASRERTVALRDEVSDPRSLIWSTDGQTLLGAVFEADRPRNAYFDPEHPESRLRRAVEASFPDEHVRLDSFTRDGRIALLRTVSDRSPGDFYFFDVERRSADHMLSRREQIDPRLMGERRPFRMTARDGRTLHGYLTIPAGSDGTGLPLIVNPHGGPFGPYDSWEFDVEPQLLASRGYAVLQLNFRGSGGYGTEFLRAGFRQWGGAMQDDLTDATRWAVEQGIADPDRMCIYGGSYGAYASLMGVAKEPDLYRCAVGYVGVYDLAMMYSRGDIPQRHSGRNYLTEAVGSENLQATSPTHLAGRIRVPVFLAAGGADERTPLVQTRAMERALKAAGVPVETLVYPTEGHGFYNDGNRLEYYRKLLAFFDQHIGGGARQAD